MANFKVLDKANEYRIEVEGKLANPSVHKIEACWKQALQANLQRQIVVDISRIDGFDSAGRALLHAMHQHGTLIAASTSLALVFLNEATSFKRGPAVFHDPLSVQDRHSASVSRVRAVAGGK